MGRSDLCRLWTLRVDRETKVLACIPNIEQVLIAMPMSLQRHITAELSCLIAKDRIDYNYAGLVFIDACSSWVWILAGAGTGMSTRLNVNIPAFPPPAAWTP